MYLVKAFLVDCLHGFGAEALGVCKQITHCASVSVLLLKRLADLRNDDLDCYVRGHGHCFQRGFLFTACSVNAHKLAGGQKWFYILLDLE